MEEFEALRAGVKAVFGNQYPTGQNSSNTMHEVLINSRRYPTTLGVAGTNFTNAFGGAVYVGGQNVDGLNRFYVKFNNVPRKVCIGVLNTLSKNGGWTHT